ncbi:MAG: ATP-grasp domain-containing protein [Hyphomicrobium sp.]|uniref:ATP-grasp domain-containing protein n=1 Tax=Hyphomicrobium sp. TaxID=82 RepID=UPI0039E42212
MSGETVLIAAFSGRSLAQSARRAGYRPFVADAFGDIDTKEAADDIRVIDGAMQTGFHTKQIVAALEDLSRASGSAPIGLVLGSGFEDKPRLVGALAARFRLLCSGAETIATCKDPKKFFGMLGKLGVRHPETQIERPSSPEDWISKRVGGSGGRHIRDCSGPSHSKPRRYFQQRLSGDRYSVGGLIDIPTSDGGRSDSYFATKQWTSPSLKHPYRFGGCVSQPVCDPNLLRDLVNIASRVGDELSLKGMASFDFIVSDGVPYLLEVNPRPGASADVLDDPTGNFFRAQMAAWANGEYWPGERTAPKAMAILHADRGPVILGNTPWPEWSADRGASGTVVPEGAPLASVFAEAATADAAEALARSRLAELEDLIYGHAKS